MFDDYFKTTLNMLSKHNFIDLCIKPFYLSLEILNNSFTLIHTILNFKDVKKIA